MLGPLVVACALTDAPEELARLGVRDSKVLAAPVREKLERDLKSLLKGYALVVLEAAEIDRARSRKSLNEIEGEAFARAAVGAMGEARAHDLEVLQADAADAKASNFRGMIVRGLAKHAADLRVGRFEVEHKADARYPAVSAASILAKVERDRRVKRLGQDCGCDIGSGYPADPVTIAFLRDYIRAHKDLPPFARRSWKPAKTLLRESGVSHRPLDRFGAGADPP